MREGKALTISGLEFSYGEDIILSNLDLKIPQGKVSCILGPSGCGKTTLLKLIAGLLPLQGGEIAGWDFKKRAFIFQEPRLLPWKTLYGNLDLVLKAEYPQKSDREERIRQVLSMVEMEAFCDYYPLELSGGMRQRVSLARAFAYPSSLLLMDEPFQALDPVLKINLADDFLKFHQQDRRTCILVTHDVEEAALLSDQIIVLSPKPAKVFYQTENLISQEARFIGSREVLELEHKLLSILLKASAN